MQTYKPLLKLESRTVFSIILYFFVTELVTLWRIYTDLTRLWYNSLNFGIARAEHWIFNTGLHGYFFPHIKFCTMLHLVGIIVFVYANFKLEKHHEKSRFLQHLPYSQEERYKVKIQLIHTVFRINFFLYAVALLLLRHYGINLFKDVVSISPLKDLFFNEQPIYQLLLYLLLCYLIIVCFYHLLVWVQYAMYPNFIGLLIPCLIISLPACILLSIDYMMVQKCPPFITKLLSYFDKFLLNTYTQRNIILSSLDHPRTISSSYIQLHYVFFKILLLLISILLLRLITYKQVQRHRIEDENVFIVSKSLNYVFILTCSLYLGCLFGDGTCYFFRHWSLNSHYGIYTLFSLLIGMVLGMILSLKFTGYPLRRAVK